MTDVSHSTDHVDARLRAAGRELLVHMYAALRSLKLYPVENAQVQKALEDLAMNAAELVELEDKIEIRMQGEFLFINGTRLRLTQRRCRSRPSPRKVTS